MKTVIYHNNQCSKSRLSLEAVKQLDADVEVIEYLKNPPSDKELKSILKMLQIPAEALIRKSEAIFTENFKGKTLTEAEWIEAMVQFPKLIERPIVIHGNKAAIGRPMEKVLELFDKK
jgi:arsenate reductase